MYQPLYQRRQMSRMMRGEKKVRDLFLSRGCQKQFPAFLLLF